MIRSDSNLSLLKHIDEVSIEDHPFLQARDEVYYLGEYTNGKKADFSPENKLILNYKKEPKWKTDPTWHYKESAIKRVADWFRLSILQTTGFPERQKNALLVPIPPHAIKSDPEYDDRNLKMLKCLFPSGKFHELITQKQSRAPLHKSSKRSIQQLEENYIIVPPLPNIKFTEIWLFDDVLRNGTHFRAAHNCLSRLFPGIKIVGFFIARSVHQPALYTS